MVNEGLIASDIAKRLHMTKPHISYYIKKAKEKGYIRQSSRDVFALLEVTQPGKNFLDQYYKNNLSIPNLRLENIQFKATVIQMPTIPVNWKKIQMHNWTQYNSQIDDVKVRLNLGKIPTLELIPSPVAGENIYDLITKTVESCINAYWNLYERIGLKLGSLRVCSRPEWVIHDPIAREFCKQNGQVTYDGIGKVNASKPRHIGEFEFFDPRALSEYLLMPQRLRNVETMLERLSQNPLRLGIIPQ